MMFRKGKVIFIVGLCVLELAFFSSALAGLGTIGEEYRTVGILEFNPDVGQWVRIILELGVLPVAAGLALVAIPFILRERISAGWEREICLLAGGLCEVWGIYDFLTTYGSYVKAISWAAQSNVTNITGSLNIIYVGYGSIAVLWLVSGAFLLITPICFGDAQ